MKNSHKKILSISILLIVFCFIFTYILINYHDFNNISIKNPVNLLPIILLLLIRSESGALVTRTILRSLNTEITHYEAFRLSIITTFYNLVTPFRGGAFARAIYLKKIHNLSYTDFIASLSATYLILYLLTSAIGLAALVYIYSTTNTLSIIYPALYFILFVFFLTIIIYCPKIRLTENKIANRFLQVLLYWNRLRNKKIIITETSIYSFIQILSSSTIFMLLYRLFGFDLSLFESIFIVSIVNFSLVFQITPANFGVQEALIALSGAAIGVPVSESLAAAILGRAVSFGLFFILGGFFSLQIYRKNLKAP